MDSLYQFLVNTKNKTGLIAILLGVMAYLQTAGHLLSDAAMGWVNLVSAVLLILFKAFAPSGTLEKGWAASFYITNGILCAIAIANVIGEAGIIPAATLATATALFNGALAAYQIYQTNKPTTY